MNKHLLLTAVLGVTLSTAGCVTKNPKPDEGDPNPPKETQLQAPDPTNADSLYAYAAQLEQKGEEQKALGYYLQATQIQPEHLKAQIALAQLYVKFNRAEEAKVAYENILRLDRQHPFVTKYKDARLKYYSALNIAQNEEYEKALELLSQAPRSTPLDKEIEETEQKWKQLVGNSKNQKLRDDIVQQASLLAYKGKYDEAVALIKKAPGAEGDVEIKGKISQWEKAQSNNGNVELTPSTPPTGQVRYISASKVHIRQSPYLYAQALTTLKQGEKVSVLMANAYQSDGYSWSKVRTGNGTVGWVASSLLSGDAGASSNTSSLPTAPDEVTTNTKTYGERYIQGDQVNVRRSPTLSGTLITSLSKNTKVSLLSDQTVSAGGYQWQKIRLPDNQVGYIASQFLGTASASEPTPEATPAPQTNTTVKTTGKIYRYINGQKVNIRSGPSTDDKIVAQLSSPARVELLSKILKKDKYNWIQIQYAGGKTGWMVTNFLTKTKPASTAATDNVRYVRSDKVNLRAQATTGSSIVKVLDEGTRVTMISQAVTQGGYKWVKVQLIDGQTGWIVTEFLGR